MTIRKGKFLLSVVLLLLVTVAGCKKYPDGPLVSLRSKKERVANNWKVGQAFENGNDVTSDYTKYELDLTKGGEASLSAIYVVLGATFEFVTSGNWTLVSDNEKLYFDFDNNDGDATYSILKLEEDDMWLKKDGDSVELHLVTR